MTQHFRIASIPADGVGTEVVAAGLRVLDSLASASHGAFAFDVDEFPWGSEYYAATGKMIADDGPDQIKDHDAIYFGAVGWPTVPDHISLWGLRLRLCQGFDQWANVRPVHFLPGITSPLRKADDTDLDWVVVRENSEGEYGGFGGRNFSGRGPGGEMAVQSAVFTEVGCERIMRFAFDLARTRPRKKLASVTKSNAQQYGMVLWDDVFKRVAARLPRHRDRERACRRDGRQVRPAPRGPRRRCRLEPQRRHPLRPRQRPGRQPRPGCERQPQSRTPPPFDVRARPRLGTGHRRAGPLQPHRRHRQRRAHARALRPSRRSQASPASHRDHLRPGHPHTRRGRHRQHSAT